MVSVISKKKMRNLKKIIFSVIFICIMYSFSTNFPKVNASELGNEIETEEDMARESLENLEKNLSESNTSVVEELNKLINDYEVMYETETSYEEKEKIEKLISTLQNHIEEYNQFSYERQLMKDEDLYLSRIRPSDPKRIYKLIVAAAIATFNYMECPLSAELLTHARQNEEVDSLYTPTKGGIILQSTLVQEKANDISIACDSERFINNGDSISKDLFYAIRRFQYEKIYKDECSIVFHIRDRYDFEGENVDLEGILKIAVGTMYKCQQAGVIKPFITDIAETMPGYVPYTYEFRNQEAIITGVPNYVNNITIPEQIMDVSTYLNDQESSLYNVTTIDDYAFYEANNLNNITLPNTVTNIGQSAFENCRNLTNIHLSNQLIEIGNAAFKGCVNLKNVIIPSSVERINPYAFCNCTKLGIVIVLKETEEITHLYENAFLGCSALQNIIVPMNRVEEYKNNDYWSNYATKIIPSSTQFDAYHIDCLSDLTTLTTLEPACNKLYQIQVECGKSYTITSTSSLAIQMSLYNANMELINDSPTMTNNNCKGTIVGYLSPGIYYLNIGFKDNTSGGTIYTQYAVTWANTGWNVTYNKNNEIIDHLHKITDNQYKNQLYYINSKGAGFYEFTLTGTKQDGMEISYPEGAIKIYNNEERTSLIEKYNLTTHNNQASSKEGQNKIIVYLPQNGYYYINIQLDTDQIATLQFNIQAVEAQKINLFDLSETTNETIPIFENNNIKVDNIKKVTIQQSGKFTIEFVYDGIQIEDILCILFKQNYNSANYEYTMETKIIEVMNNENQVKEITLTLDAGTYYIGYFNKNDTKTMTTHLTRIITQYGSHALVPDPDDQTPYGSQIAIAEQDIYLYNRSYRGTNILEGFTRLIYLDDDYAPSVSRLDYDFYTSNESIATVSAYGTVQALNVTKDTNVKIMAVYKKDRSIVFTKTFTIVNDRKTYDSAPIDITINMTIKDGVYTSIKFKNIAVPDQMLQHYFWTSKDATKVTVDSYGRLYANSQAIGQTIEIEGAYMYNERVKIKIKVTVID